MKRMMRTSISFTMLAAAVLLASCEKPAIDKTGRLLTMAGEEAANIPNKLDRFTRQLNIANTQLDTNRKADAAAMLALARDTLNAAGKTDFDDFHRIAAWTAISQLSRRAGDRDLALKSSDNALAALNDVQPMTQRPQYVLSLAGELADLRGNQAAIELLESGSGWAAEIKDPSQRRLALVTFAQRLITLDAFDNARNTLRRDPDAVWRTDTFLSLANQNAPVVMDNFYANARETSSPPVANTGGFGGRGAGGGAGGFSQQMAPAMAPAATAPNDSQARRPEAWSQDVRFENVFKQGN